MEGSFNPLKVHDPQVENHGHRAYQGPEEGGYFSRYLLYGVGPRILHLGISKYREKAKTKPQIKNMLLVKTTLAG